MEDYGRVAALALTTHLLLSHIPQFDHNYAFSNMVFLFVFSSSHLLCPVILFPCFFWSVKPEKKKVNNEKDWL